MNSAADACDQPQGSAPGTLLSFLRESMRPYPGRMEATMRMVLACLIIVSISMSLQVPSQALAAYMVFFVSREDMATTAKTGIALIVAFSLAIVLSLLVFRVTVNEPALRLALMTILFTAGMYVSRIFVLGALGFGLGFVFLITQSTVDLYPAGEPLVRDTLWLWVALTFSIVVVILVNVLVLPARPVALLREEAVFRLNFVATHLSLSGSGPTLPSGAMRALDPMRPFMLMKLAGGDPDFARRAPAYRAALASLSKLIEAACMLAALPSCPPLARQEARMQRLRKACLSMARSVANPAERPAPPVPHAPTSAPSPDQGPAPAQGPDAAQGPVPGLASARATGLSPGPALTPAERYSVGGGANRDSLLGEMESDMTEVWQHWDAAQRGAGAADAAPASKPKPFAADAFSNPAYMQFALKVTFAAMLCYVLYTGFNWPGIHTCVVTCAVIALTTNGATVHKATQRILGALAGGALALLATVFIVPHLESLGGLLLLIAPVALASAWISTGGERIAYFGWQMAFAFFLCILHGYGPSEDVTIVRDRLVGILLGTVVMGVMFRYVWPERASDQLRHTLARILRTCDRRTVLQDLRTAGKQAEAAAFEGTLSHATRTEALFAATQAVALICLHAGQRSAEVDDVLRQYADYLSAGHHAGRELPACLITPAHSPEEQALLTRIQWLRSRCIDFFGGA